MLVLMSWRFWPIWDEVLEIVILREIEKAYLNIWDQVHENVVCVELHKKLDLGS